MSSTAVLAALYTTGNQYQLTRACRRSNMMRDRSDANSVFKAARNRGLYPIHLGYDRAATAQCYTFRCSREISTISQRHMEHNTALNSRKITSCTSTSHGVPWGISTKLLYRVLVFCLYRMRRFSSNTSRKRGVCPACRLACVDPSGPLPV